jgi:hypothetical protein
VRILLTGNTYSNSPEQLYLRLLKQRSDVVVDFIPTGKMFLDKRKSLSGKVLYRLAPKQLNKSIQDTLLERINTFLPDVVLVFKGFEISVETLQTIKQQGVKLVNFNGDHPFAYDSKGSGNQNTLKSIELFDLYLTYSKNIQGQMNARYSTRTEVLPFGFDQDAAGKFEELEEINKACFVGNPDAKRAQYIQHVADAGISIDVYGNDWNQFLKPGKTLNIFPPATGVKYWQTLHRYRVQLNIMRTHNENSHNMRTFEVPGIGGIMLTEQTLEQEEFFTDKEVATYNSETDLIEQTGRLLSKTTSEADAMRERAKKCVLNNGHTYMARSEQLVDLIRSIQD